MKKTSRCEPEHNAAKAWLDRVLDSFSYFVVPLALLVFSVLALWGGNVRQAYPGLVLPFHALVDTSDRSLDLDEARRMLAKTPPVEDFNTHLSEQPVWLLVPADGQNWSDHFIDFPSRHGLSMACWDAASLAEVGSANRRTTHGTMAPFRAGFVVHETQPHSGLLCRGVYSGPARVRATLWPQAAFAPLLQAFEWGGGLFEGGFITLALFTLLAAIVNRESRYMLLTIWLIGNLRLGAMSMGWDMQWLGRPVPPEWLYPMRQLTVAAYYIVTYSLFCQVFRDELQYFASGPRRIVRNLGVLLLMGAVALPYRLFLPMMWGIVSIGAGVLTLFLIRSVLRNRSRSALWYGAALMTVLFASLSEVIAAAFEINVLLSAFNSITAAVAASLMAAFAFADQVRFERADRLRAQEALQRTYHVTPVGLFTLDAQGNFLRVNNALAKMTAQGSTHQHVTRSWDERFGVGSFAKLKALAQLTDGGETEIRVDSGGTDGSAWYLVRVARAGERIEGSLQNITERKKLTERLHFLADNDFLTGVYNRRGIEARLERAIGAVARGATGSLALAYLDLDRFKLINDLYGHQIGDEVLKQVARRVNAVVAKHCRLGRMGGDEFLLIMPETSLDQARVQCQRVVEAIVGKHFYVRTHAFWVRVSVGLVEIAAGISVNNAITVADRACREAKMGKLDHLVFYPWQATAFRDQAEELQIMQSMVESHLPKGLFLVMQPIMSLHNPRGALDFEVLIRLRTDDGAVVSASRVIAAIETHGSVTQLDGWVLNETLAWLRANHARLGRTRFVCVNLSGASLNDEAFMADTMTTLTHYRDVAHLLCLEITEGVAVHDIENGRRFIERLRQFGSRVALDDFGAGYTSFLYLKELPADALKIDGSFISTLNQHPANVAILESIVQLARNLGMRSVAEWVEDIDTLQTLSELGVDYVQGYLIARPLVPSALLAATSAADFVADPAVVALIDEITAAKSPRDAADEGGDCNGLRRYH